MEQEHVLFINEFFGTVDCYYVSNGFLHVEKNWFHF